LTPICQISEEIRDTHRPFPYQRVLTMQSLYDRFLAYDSFSSPRSRWTGKKKPAATVRRSRSYRYSI